MIVPSINHLITLALVTITPWIELRGAIPIGIGLGLNSWFVFIFTVFLNILIIPLIYYGLEFFYERFFKRFKILRNLVENVRRKGEKYILKYGIIGMVIFVGIPLPGTGAYSGTILAWLLGMKKREAFPAVVAGVLIAGIIVTLISMGFFKVLYFFLYKIG